MQTKRTTAIEQYAINKVREIRKQKKISQAKLENMIDKSNGFVGRVESSKQSDKYNLNHLNAIAKAMNCSPKDFLPDKPLIE